MRRREFLTYTSLAAATGAGKPSSVPATLLFFGVGTALFVFYKSHPEKLGPTFQNDAIFPLFIAHELPAGIAGLVVVAIFAAAQSIISTSMNGTATAIDKDFIRRFNLLPTEQAYLRDARALTVLMGALGTALALLFAMSDIKSLWDSFMAILGRFGGAMCGLFLLGIFTCRANGRGAIIGAFLGAVGLYAVQRFTPTSFLIYASIGIGICFFAGYLASLCFLPPPEYRLAGLTYWTRKKIE